jgi:hypothetical protein
MAVIVDEITTIIVAVGAWVAQGAGEPVGVGPTLALGDGVGVGPTEL